MSTGAERLAGVLTQIVEHDTDYDVRYPLVFEALALALDLDMPAGIAIDPAEPDWPVVYIELPTGQVSWHMPKHAHSWDGHTTEQKHQRITAFTAHIAGHAAGGPVHTSGPLLGEDGCTLAARPELAGLLVCPNTPPCEHPALVHDVDELNAPRPRCCADGCACGRLS